MSGNCAGRLVRLIAIAIVIGLGAIGSQSALADEPEAAKPASFELAVSPAAEPVPALKYHLLPPREEVVPGNAAPIYLRVIWQQKPEWHQFMQTEPRRLTEFSLADLPLDEAKKVVSAFEYAMVEFAAAARRSDCDWQHVFTEDPLKTLLPDAQAMRNFAYAIVIAARVQLREEDPRAATASLGTGMALAQNVAKAPFLVSELVGLAISQTMLAELDQVVSAENAPNLYWALVELPDPLISFDRGLATDKNMLLERFPELKVPHASIDWQGLADRMRAWAREAVSQERPELIIDGSISQEMLAMARTELPRVSDFSAEAVAAMSDGEVEVRYVLALFRATYDQWRKWYYLPLPQVLDSIAARSEELQAETQRREIYPLPSVLVPLKADLLMAQVRASRNVARQQVIEALRMHAAAAGKFPQSLDEVQVVPVPVDPATGKPFAYKLEGGVAVLDVEDPAGMTRESLRLPVRIGLRK